MEPSFTQPKKMRLDWIALFAVLFLVGNAYLGLSHSIEGFMSFLHIWYVVIIRWVIGLVIMVYAVLNELGIPKYWKNL